jgi:UDP-4-amino-4-deoxy-L-arabinose formyltransferase/UDP-glucuronic acid dehydrogenase (UDP-4-keto-hexauronic acid decarboxylating)
MRIAAIGRTEILYETIGRLAKQGHEIALIVTSQEAPEYTKTAEDLKLLASRLGARFIKTAKIDMTIDQVKEMPPVDIAVSINYSGIIPQKVIDLFRLGILNAHGGDLPRYRGNACQAWAIINGESRVGLCVHSMIGGELDNGNIIARAYIPIDHTTKVTTLWQWMAEKTPVLFEDAVNKLNENPDFILEVQSKSPEDALRCYPRVPEDGKIDWKQSNLDVLRLINASNKPYAGAFCDFEESKLVIWDAELIDDDENYLAIPGQITQVGDDYIDVATGDGKIRINEVEYKGTVSRPNMIIKSIRKRLK